MADPKPKRDLYAEVAAKLIAQIERNPGDPKMPWRRTVGAPLWMPANALTENHYRGINVLTLWATAEEKGYSSNIWATYKQYVRRVSRMKGVTSWVREQCPALSPHPACWAGNGTV